MTPDPRELGRKPRRVSSATYRLMESYKDSYPNHAQGILQEAIQNAIDARVNPDSYRDVAVTIEYDKKQRTLRIRDYGTTGMSHCQKCYWGIRRDNGADCHEKGCRWGYFHYLGGLGKDAGQLGFRGQGKSLAIVAGERFVVRTLVRDGTSTDTMASEWTRDEDEAVSRLVPDEAMKADDKPGTALIIYGVKQQVHEELLKTDDILFDIGRTWFNVIEEGARIRFGYAGMELTKVATPTWPAVQLNENNQEIVRHRASIPVSVNRKEVGQLVDVELYLAAEPVPEEVRGIALIKNGTQTIDRYQPRGRKIPIELQDRLYGWATFRCSDEKPFLLTCENPNHKGFQPHPYYRRTQELLQDLIEDFLMPYAQVNLRPRINEKDRKRAEQNLDVIQKALAELPEFNPWTGEGEIDKPRKTKEPPNHAYISSIQLDKKSYNRGEVAKVNVIVLNPHPEDEPFIHLTVEGLDTGFARLTLKELPAWELPYLKAAQGERKGRIEVNVDVPVTPDFVVGENWVRATLIRQPPAGTEASAEVPEPVMLGRGAHSLWVEEEPEKKTRGPKTKPTRDGPRPGTMSELRPISDGLDPVQNEIWPDWQKGQLWYYTKGVRIAPVYESNHRAADSILYEIVSEVIADRVMQTRVERDVRDTFDRAAMLDEFRKMEDLRKRFLHICERIRNVQEEE